MSSRTAVQAHAGVGSFVVLGMRVDTLDWRCASDRIFDLIHGRQPAYVCVSNVHQCMLTRDDPDFADVINEAAFVVTDSRILHKAVESKYRLKPLPTVRGAEMMMELCARAEREKVGIALVGGRDEPALADLEETLVSRFPALQIELKFSPPFRTQTDEELIEFLDRLKRSGAQLVFVGLGCPKQERWMAKNSPFVCATMIGVGAAFDFNSGAVKKSPAWVHAAGLESLYRLASEPRRLWRRYLGTSPRFIVLYVVERLLDRLGR